MKTIFKARPHPDLLLQEKEQREDIFWFMKRLFVNPAVLILKRLTWEKPSPGERGG
jgi:hypothetical protein